MRFLDVENPRDLAERLNQLTIEGQKMSVNLPRFNVEQRHHVFRQEAKHTQPIGGNSLGSDRGGGISHGVTYA